MQLAILAQPNAFDPERRRGRAVDTLHRAVDYRRNPRDREYMMALARREGRGAWTIVEDGPALTDAALRDAESIVLLWPDGNGYGWTAIERRVWRTRRPDAVVSVLNGRQRSFELTPSLWRRFRLRRALERSWVGEVAFLSAGVLVGLPLLMWDTIRGRT
jgi:hypothetical protein